MRVDLHVKPPGTREGRVDVFGTHRNDYVRYTVNGSLYVLCK